MTAKKLAYQIHEAMYSAETLKFERYQSLRSVYSIRLSADKVIAEKKNALTMPDGKLSFSEFVDPLDIVQTIIRHKNIDFDLIFPNASQALHDKQLIHEWCKEEDYSYDYTDAGLVISRMVREHKRLNLGDLE